MSEFTTTARPYARAVFELARETNTVPQWSRLLAALAKVLSDESLAALINDPKISRWQIADSIADGFAAGLSDDQRRFIHLLVGARRLPAAGEIAELFEAYRADAEQSIQAQVVSARPLDEDQLRSFQQALEKRTRKTVHLSARVDETLVGGALVRAGDRVIDGSLKNGLKNLATALTY